MPAPPGAESMVVEGREGRASPPLAAPLPEGGPRRVIVWFRRDLRLADNPALVAALRMAPEVVSPRAHLCVAQRGRQACVAPWHSPPA